MGLTWDFDHATDLEAARSLLLRTEYETSGGQSGWCTKEVGLHLLSPTPRRDRHPQPPFDAHETYDLPDAPPVDGMKVILLCHHAHVLDCRLFIFVGKQCFPASANHVF